MATTLVAIAWFWLDPLGLGMIGLLALGLGLAGIFPTLVSVTPAWVGADRSPSIIGYQIAASSLGAASLPWLTGQWMESDGLERLGPALLIAGLLMSALHVAVQRRAGEISRPDSIGTLPS